MAALEKEAANASSPRFRFSTDLVPERERVAFFKEELAKVLRLDVELLGDSSPSYAIDSVLAGPVAINTVQGSPTRVSRTGAHLADGDDSLLFVLHTGGAQIVEHNGNLVLLNPGDACLVHNGRTSTATYRQGGSTIAIRIDASALDGLLRNPDNLAGRLISRRNSGVGLLFGYLRAFSDRGDECEPGTRRLFGSHIVDLVAAVLGATRDGQAQADAGGLRAARLHKILARIETNACRHDFTVEKLASELGVTSRTVQHILEETGSTFSEHVAEQRLKRARRLLTSPRNDLSIAEIAYEAGYNDISHFYRTFRRRFGDTPAAVRASGSALH
jgi:AraC-like DNA-binding protein